jgi:multidrug resistance efflux pump
MKKLIIINIVSLVVLLGGGALGYYFYDQNTNYLKTDNAQIDGQQIIISAPTNGKIVDWKGTNGKEFKANDTIGTITSATANTNVDVTTPQDVTVVLDKAIPNSLVAAGTPLAYGYDMNHLYVTANIKETEVKDVEVGQDVDVYVDSIKNTSFKGTVSEIGKTTAGVFTLLPSSNANANFTKVTQVIPVKITISDVKGYDLLPGENVTVRIHK